MSSQGDISNAAMRDIRSNERLFKSRFNSDQWAFLQFRSLCVCWPFLSRSLSLRGPQSFRCLFSFMVSRKAVTSFHPRMIYDQKYSLCYGITSLLYILETGFGVKRWMSLGGWIFHGVWTVNGWVFQGDQVRRWQTSAKNDLSTAPSLMIERSWPTMWFKRM